MALVPHTVKGLLGFVQKTGKKDHQQKYLFLSFKIFKALSIHSSVVFQIGRSTESPIDFVVTDTVAGGQEGEETPITQSTISRFACRVVCERSPPYTARIYAAGFDSSKNIFLGVITLQSTAIDLWHLLLGCCLNQRLAVDSAPFSNPSVFTRERR